MTRNATRATARGGTRPNAGPVARDRQLPKERHIQHLDRASQDSRLDGTGSCYGARPATLGEFAGTPGYLSLISAGVSGVAKAAKGRAVAVCRNGCRGTDVWEAWAPWRPAERQQWSR